jgi:hypothetical protein
MHASPWTSAQNVAGGSFWHEELWNALKTARLGVLCLTPDNVESKWIHFEGGAIARSFGRTFACPYLLNVDPSQVSVPLGHLQCLKANEQDTLHLVKAINATLRVGKLNHEMLLASFMAHWPALRSTLEKVAMEEKAARPAHDILEFDATDRMTVIDAEYVDSTEAFTEGQFGMPLPRQFMHGHLSTSDAAAVPMAFDLSVYPDDMLLALLNKSHKLNLLVLDEIQARARRLLPDSDTSRS